jgi:hypothetical protein
MPSMPYKARIYIAVVIALGAAQLAGCLIFQRQFGDPVRYLGYGLLALLASTCKVRLPGVTGTMSLNFVFVLIGVAEFSYAETLTMGCAAGLVQSVWKSRRRRPVQAAFNVAALALSIAVAYHGSRMVLAAAGTESLPVLLALGAYLYFVANTMLVSTVVALIEGRALKSVWQQCYLWSFPYYLVGAAVAGLISGLNSSLGWKLPILVLPAMYLVYTFYRLYLERLEQQRSLPV